uniref:Uncharacterized protein n=1 Tax=Arundo donax TaxID=35708 RepID=A0A0A9BSP7_ARUDO
MVERVRVRHVWITVTRISSASLFLHVSWASGGNGDPPIVRRI